MNSSGEIYAESVGSNIVLENVDAGAVDVGTVGGRIRYEGTLRSGGTYFFGAHGGSVTLVVPDGTGASFTLATIHGSITSNLPGAPERFKRGQRNSFQVGGGGATVDVETFAGRVRVIRAGSEEALDRADRENGNMMVNNALGGTGKVEAQSAVPGVQAAPGGVAPDAPSGEAATSRR